jgi:hypothetical protein
MRNLPLLLALLLLSVLLSAASAQASLLPVPAPAQPFVMGDEEEAEEDEAEEAEEEFCTFEEEEEELCEEDEEEVAPKGKDKGEECLLKSADAAITANPGKRRLRLTVHYKTLKPTTVNVEASLKGPKGTVRLGTEHARFRRSGVYRDTFSLPEKQAKKALAAREFSVELHVVNAPSSCDVELTGASPRAKR